MTIMFWILVGVGGFVLYCGFILLVAQCMGINRLKYQAMQRAEAVREERRLRLVGRK